MKLLELSTLLLMSSLVDAWVGGPCAKSFNKDGYCICLHQKTCKSKWHGQVVTGKSGNWPCPDDDNDVHGCEINGCFGFFTACKWTSSCPKDHIGPRNHCPGGSNFRCCFTDP